MTSFSQEKYTQFTHVYNEKQYLRGKVTCGVTENGAVSSLLPNIEGCQGKGISGAFDWPYYGTGID